MALEVTIARGPRRQSVRRVELPPAPLRLTLLGGFELTSNEGPVPLQGNGQRLLAFLALHDRPVPRSHVAGLLWLDSSEERACGNLRSTLWRLRRPGQLAVQDCFGRLTLAPSMAVDLRNAVRRLRALLDTAVGCEPAEVAALASLGEVLPDWDEDWVLIERERFRQFRLHALEALCEHLSRDVRFAEALEVGLAAIAAEPLRESAQRAVVRVHLAEGNPGEALRQYWSYRHLLREELGLEPSLKMEELVGGLTGR